MKTTKLPIPKTVKDLRKVINIIIDEKDIYREYKFEGYENDTTLEPPLIQRIKAHPNIYEYQQALICEITGLCLKYDWFTTETDKQWLESFNSYRSLAFNSHRFDV